MEDAARGQRLRLSCNRTLVIDLLHYDRQAPMVAHDRVCDLSRLAERRERASRRVSWSILFLKAYALTAREFPPLRQCLLRWPWTHLYEHPHSVAMLAVNREFEGEERLCWARFHRPEEQPLAAMQQALDERYKSQPVEKVFRRQVLLSRLPTPFRRLAWWATRNLSGPRRAKRLGTFGLTTIAAQGAEIRRPPSPLTTTLTYGPLDEANRCRVTIAYDHRIMDGALIGRALARLEDVLRGPIAEELWTPRAAPSTAEQAA